MPSRRSKEEQYGDFFSREKRAQIWNDLYDKPSTLFHHNMARRRDHVCQLVADRYSQDAKILDLGCGAGVVMEELLRRGFKVTGADRSVDMLDLARKRLRGFPHRSYELHESACENLCFENEAFDVVLCVGVFGYIDDVVAALLEIRRVLRPAGLLVISVRNSFNSLISDPIRAPRLLAQQVHQRLRKAPETAHYSEPSTVPVESGCESPPALTRPPQFQIDILQYPRSLIRGITRCGYALDYFAGFGFGPLAVRGHDIFSTQRSIRISDYIGDTLDRLGLGLLTRYLGDVSIYGFLKASD